jgi:hypothetical protein
MISPMYSYSYAAPYLLVFVFILMMTFPVANTSTGNSIYRYENFFKNIQVTIAISVLVFFIGFRGFIGTDWISYFNFYKQVPSLFDGIDELTKYFKNNSWEWGFLSYAILCKTISKNYFFFQFTLTAINFFIIFFLLKMHVRENIILGFVIYFLFCFGMETQLLRNSKAILLFFISLHYIWTRERLKFFGLNIVGCFFHITSILYFPLYFILRKKYSRNALIFLFLLGNILFLLKIRWLSSIIIPRLVIPLCDLFHWGLFKMAANYINSQHYSAPWGISIGYIERTLSFVLILFFYNKLCENNKFNVIAINCMFIYLFVYLYCSDMMILVSRLPILLSFAYCLVYPQLFKLLSRKWKLIFVFVLVVYGGLKILKGQGVINYAYENAVFSYSSYEKRLPSTLKVLTSRGKGTHNQ